MPNAPTAIGQFANLLAQYDLAAIGPETLGEAVSRVGRKVIAEWQEQCARLEAMVRIASKIEGGCTCRDGERCLTCTRIAELRQLAGAGNG